MTRYRKGRPGYGAPNQLWRYRHKRGFSQWQVADLLGYVSRSRISEYEHGERMPSLLTALKLELILRTPISFLYPELTMRLKAQLREREERLREKWEEHSRRSPSR